MLKLTYTITGKSGEINTSAMTITEALQTCQLLSAKYASTEDCLVDLHDGTVELYHSHRRPQVIGLQHLWDQMPVSLWPNMNSHIVCLQKAVSQADTPPTREQLDRISMEVRSYKSHLQICLDNIISCQCELANITFKLEALQQIEDEQRLQDQPDQLSSPKELS